MCKREQNTVCRVTQSLGVGYDRAATKVRRTVLWPWMNSVGTQGMVEFVDVTTIIKGGVLAQVACTRGSSGRTSFTYSVVHEMLWFVLNAGEAECTDKWFARFLQENLCFSERDF